MKLLLLANASAASVTPRVRVVIGELLAAEHDVTVAETSRRGHASRLAQGAAADGYEVVVVLGGDGTVNEAANGLVGSSTAMGLLPGGSTNVLARTLGFTNDPVKAAGELLLALRQPERSIRRIGLGRANGRYFLFHAGLGFDAAVVEQVEKRGSLKRFAGHPLFVYATILTWLRHFDRTRPHFDIVVVDGPEPGRKITGVYFAICLKTNPYTFLGNRPLHVAPETGFDSGLSLVTFRTLDLATMLTMAASALRSGRLLRHHRRLSNAAGLDRISVTAYGPVPYQVDGDYLGMTEHLELSWEPEALTLLVP